MRMLSSISSHCEGTLAIENAARGHDYAEVLEQRALEERRMKELGLENKEDPVDERVSTRTEE